MSSIKASRRATYTEGSGLNQDADAEYGATEDSASSPQKSTSNLSSSPAKSTSNLSKRHTVASSSRHHFDARWSVEDDNESMDDVSIIINLLADLSPAGVLPLSYGMIGTGYVPSMIILLLFTAGAGYVMYLISRTMERCKVQMMGWQSFDLVWSAVVSKGTAWIPTFTVFSVTFGCCLAYACMFGDLFAGCMPAFGLSFATRTVCLIALSIFPLLPLCMLKDLSLLAPTSFAALVAVLYTLVMMVARYADGSYAPGGEFFVEAPPPAGDHTFTLGASSLLLVNGLAVAFLCHYNGCKYYREFIAHTPGKFARRITLAFSCVMLMFAVAMMIGYATFGAFSDGVILNSYASDDMLANAARVGMGFANVCSFPLMFSGLREQSLALMAFISPSLKETTELVMFQNIFSAVMLLIITIIAIIVTDASLVVGLVGSICGSATIYVIPCILMDLSHANADPRAYGTGEKILVRSIAAIGVFLMVAGAIATVTL